MDLAIEILHLAAAVVALATSVIVLISKLGDARDNEKRRK